MRSCLLGSSGEFGNQTGRNLPMDLRGNRTAVVDALNNRTMFTYDLATAYPAITYPDTTSVTFGYDSRGRHTP